MENYALTDDNSICLNCPLQGLTSVEDDCECTDFAYLDIDGICKCHDGFISSEIDECINCVDLSGCIRTDGVCGCGDGAFVDEFGICSCSDDFVKTVIGKDDKYDK
jgi:hypothetical protein